MTRHNLSALLVVLILLLSFTADAAPTIHFGPTPSWVIPVKENESHINVRDVNDGYYLRLYEDEANLIKDEVYSHMIKEITTDAGVQNASDISINFDPLYESLTIHHISVWRDGKQIDKMQKNAFKVLANEKDLAMFLYHGSYSAYIILDDIRKGDRLEYDFTISGSNPIYNKKFASSHYFQGTEPIGQVHYSVIAPTTRKLNFKCYNDAPQPDIKTTGSATLYNWDLGTVAGALNISNAPAWFDPFQFVQISEYGNWNEVAVWGYNINKPNDKPNGLLDKRISELQEKYGTDTTGLFRAIVSIVQNEVRYMGVEMGPYSHKANDPCKVYNQRYGDCKDKSLLLVSMLHSVGIKADMAIVNTDKTKVEDYLPSPLSFNHAVTLAHVQGKDVWIDATIAGQGGKGTNIYFPCYSKALILSPATTELIATPEKHGGEIRYTEDYITGGDESKPVSLTVYTIFTGNKADDMRTYVADQSKAELEKSYQSYYTKIYPHLESTDSVAIIDNKEGDTLETIEKYVINDFYDRDNSSHEYSAGFYASMISRQMPQTDNNKKYPIAVAYPYKIHYSVHVISPNGWTIPPKNERIFRDAYHFSYDLETTGNKLSIDYELEYFRDNIAPKEIAEYANDRKKITDDLLSFSFKNNTDAGTNSTDTSTLLRAAVPAIILISLFAARTYRARRNRDRNRWY